VRCSKCGADNREQRKFRAKCAAALARSCAQCGASNEPGEDFCGECAAPLGRPRSLSSTILGVSHWYSARSASGTGFSQTDTGEYPPL